MGRSRHDTDELLMNIFDQHTPQTGETFTTLLSHKNITIQHIVSSDTIENKTYVQAEDEWVILLEGEATLLIEAEEKKLIKGEMLFIPAHTSHRILETQKGTLWLAVHIH